MTQLASKQLSSIDTRIMLLLLAAPFVTFSNTYLGSVIVFLVQLVSIALLLKVGIKTPTLPKDIKYAGLVLLVTMLVSLTLVALNYGSSINLFFASTRTLFLVTQWLYALLLVGYLYQTRCSLPMSNLFGLASLLIVFATVISVFSSTYAQELSEGEFVFAYNRRYIGYTALVAAVMLSTLVVQGVANRWQQLLLMVSFALMVWLGGRGTMVAYIASLLLVAGAVLWHGQLQHKLWLKLFVILLLSCAVSLPVSLFEWNGLNRFLSAEQTLQALESSSVVYRYKLWAESIALFQTQPWVGLGADAFKLFSQTHYFQPHNFIFQTLVEFGALGTLCVVYLLTRLAWYVLTALKSHYDAIHIALASGVCALVVQALVSGNFYHAGSLAQFLILVAVLLQVTGALPLSSSTQTTRLYNGVPANAAD